MRLIHRYIKNVIIKDLIDRMVFVGGPRQVGKTTLAISLLSDGSPSHPAYFNWDVPKIRPALFKGELPPNQSLIVLDEIHKFAQWRSLVKGFFDIHKGERSFIVTGSARLDYYRKGGDSLQGRYHYYRLHPLSLMEIAGSPSREDLESLLKFGGFPEPFLRGEERFWRRWHREMLQRVIYDDIRDLEHVKEITMMELMAEELPNRVGSPLSVRSLMNLLQVAHDTVERWLKVFERMYYIFRIPPFGAPKIRAVKKEQKLYLWDWSVISEIGYRFENLVASQLLKYCHFREDTEGHKMELRFLRDTDKREIDFVVLQEKNPLFAVECKTGERHLSPSIPYFKERTDIPKFYQVHLGQKDVVRDGIRILPFLTFCKEMEMP